jgi:putative acetyltransferase
MTIRLDDLLGPEIAAFLEEHVREMRSVSPPESTHALDLAGLRKPEITFWTVWDKDRLVGCCALKQLDRRHAEVKSMRVSASDRGKGVASTMVRHLIEEAKTRGYHRLSLETGAMPFFEPARTLYRKFQFTDCGPFGSYKEDANSVFMARVV